MLEVCHKISEALGSQIVLLANIRSMSKKIVEFQPNVSSPCLLSLLIKIIFKHLRQISAASALRLSYWQTLEECLSNENIPRPLDCHIDKH